MRPRSPSCLLVRPCHNCRTKGICLVNLVHNRLHIVCLILLAVAIPESSLIIRGRPCLCGKGSFLAEDMQPSFDTRLTRFSFSLFGTATFLLLLLLFLFVFVSLIFHDCTLLQRWPVPQVALYHRNRRHWHGVAAVAIFSPRRVNSLTLER